MNTRAGERGLAAFKRVNYESRQVERHGQTEVGGSASSGTTAEQKLSRQSKAMRLAADLISIQRV